MKVLSSLIIAVFAFLFLVSCHHPWRNARIALEITSDAAIQTDAILTEVQQPALEKVRFRVEKEYSGELTRFRLCREVSHHDEDCHDPGTPEQFVRNHYDRDEVVVKWGQVAGGLQSIKSALITADGCVTAWKETKEQPAQWPHVCSAIGTAADQVTRALKSLEVDVPPAWDQGQQYLAPLCHWAGGEF